MLCVTDDDYSEDDAEVHVGAYVAPRPHIQAQLTRLGREIERMLACEPGQTLNLCKLPEKYMAYYSRPIGGRVRHGCPASLVADGSARPPRR